MNKLNVGKKIIGKGFPTFVISEIGINHNGDIELAKQLIDLAVRAGCDAVKFQKRNPEDSVPDDYKDVKKETPWGIMTYLEYKKRIEFSEKEYDIINDYCKEKDIIWSASPWDLKSIDFLKKYDLEFIKVPSALITHREYLNKLKTLNKPLFVSTGMADMELVRKVVEYIGEDKLLLFHTVSSYPAKNSEVNLKVIKQYLKEFNCPVGYSGHEVGLQITLASVVLGACAVERHITLDRSMWGTDQSASLEPVGLIKLIRDLRIIEGALGDGVKKIEKSEINIEKKLRKINSI